MFTVYVKHYLTPIGIAYFHQDWFPRVKLIMSQQRGYISIEHDALQDNNDCINIIVVFQNETTLQDWAAHPEHDDLVNALDPYRSRHYWEVATIDHENSIPITSISAWEKIEAVTFF